MSQRDECHITHTLLQQLHPSVY